MKSDAYTLILIALLTGLMLQVQTSQSQNIAYTNYDVNSGLPSSEVYDVERDKNGKLWFATDRGLCRYDGYEFTTFTTQDGLPNNTILHMFKSPQGQIWMTGLGCQLSYIENETIFSYEYNKELWTSIKGLKRNERFNGPIWLSGIAWGPNDELYVWPSRKPFPPVILDIAPSESQFQLVPSSDMKDRFSQIEIENQFYFDLGNYLLPDTSALRKFYFTRLRQELFFTSLFTKTLYQHSFDSVQNTYVETNKLHLDHRIDCLFTDINNNLLVGTTRGLLIYRDGDLRKKAERYLNGLTVTDVEQDEEQHYWVTTLEKGIFQIPSFSIQVLPGSPSLLSEENTYAFRTYRDQLIFSTSSGKMIALNKQLQQKLLFQNDRLIGNLWDFNLKDSLLYTGYNSFNLQTGQIVDPENVHFDKHTFPLANNQLVGYGVNNFIIYDSLKLQKTVPRSSIEKRTICLLEQDSILWIGSGQGLYKITNYQFLHPQAILKPPLDQTRINDILYDSLGNLWLATVGNGLCYLTSDTLIQISGTQLNSNMVNRIFLENDSTLWAGTNKGLQRISYTALPHFEIKAIDQLSDQDGLLSNYINDIQLWNDQIFVATNGGINYFSPDIFQYKSYPVPNISLDQVNINNQTLSRDSSHSQTFSHKQNNIHFQFTGISYQRSKKHTFYRYRLRNTESVDSSWIYTNDRNARYNDLAAGQYTFEAAARNRQGEWSTNPIRYHFQILPHFSQTLLFRLAVLLGLGGLINWLYQLRNKREKIQQAQRQRIATAELKTKQAELLTLRNQMNPHFIYNVLNSIQNFIVRQDVFRANEYLSNFSKLIRNSLRFSRLQYISIAEEIDFLENYLSLEKMRFPKLFSYEIELPEELSAHHWYLPALLIQPLVENAVKHAFKERKNDGEIHIQFHISIPGKLIQICVTDNGIGLHKSKEYRNSSTLHQSMGLDIIQQQIDIINDQIETQLASLNISDLSQKYPSKTGTQAILTLPIYEGYN